MQRTGHSSSVMLVRYRRDAKTAQELGLGWLLPLHEVIPEPKILTAEPTPSAVESSATLTRCSRNLVGARRVLQRFRRSCSRTTPRGPRRTAPAAPTQQAAPSFALPLPSLRRKTHAAWRDNAVHAGEPEAELAAVVFSPAPQRAIVSLRAGVSDRRNFPASPQPLQPRRDRLFIQVFGTPIISVTRTRLACILSFACGECGPMLRS